MTGKVGEFCYRRPVGTLGLDRPLFQFMLVIMFFDAEANYSLSLGRDQVAQVGGVRWAKADCRQIRV